jgi:hypothetical protein
MAETVGQHSVAAFTSPVNGTTPIDANTVRGNDNTVRSAYVDHDADPGIHVQSSTLASRPVAGTAGRKWVTVSSGRYQFWYDDGSRWNEVASDAINVDCLADTALTKGDVVKITGFNNGQNLPTVAKVSASTDTAFGLVENTVSSGALVQIINTGLIEDVDTNGYAVGTVLYPNTSGGWTTTKPTSGNYQPAGYVLRGNTNTGVLYVEFSAPRIVERSDNTASTIVLRDASGNFSAGTITATTLAGTLSTAAQPNVTSVGTLTSLAVSGDITASAGSSTDPSITFSGYTNWGFGIDGTGLRVVSGGAGTTTTFTTSGLTTSNAVVSGDLTVDTSTLKVDSANNRVGILTASPAYALDLASGIARFDSSGGDGLRVYGGSGTNQWDIYCNSTNLRFSDNTGGGSAVFDTGMTVAGNLAVDTNTLYVDAANNRVGIGTASPLQQLHLSSASATGLQITFQGTGAARIGVASGNALTFGIDTSNGETERMRLDTSGNLGLGVTPSALTLSGRYFEIGYKGNGVLSVSDGTSFVSNAYYDGAWKYGYTGAAAYYANSAGQHRFYTAPSGTAGNAISFTQAMTLAASDRGTLGVGPSATSPQSIGSNFATVDIRNTTGGGVIFGNPTDYGYLYADSTSTNLATTTAKPLTFLTNGTERARIDASGNLAIGRTSASARLHVQDVSGSGGNTLPTNAQALFETNGNGGIALSAPTTSSVGVYFPYSTDGYSYGVERSTTALAFKANGSERARITSGGYFKASNDGTYTGSTSNYHEFRNSTSNVVLDVKATNASYADTVFVVGASRAASSAFTIIAAQANSVNQFAVTGDGVIYAQNTTVQSLSDARLKENVVDATEGLAVITALRPVRYDWKAGYGNDRTNQLGFIAQEVEAVFPDAVSAWAMDEPTGEVDEDGKPITEKVDYKTVGPGALIPVLVKAIQELEARIAVLEAGA